MQNTRKCDLMALRRENKTYIELYEICKGL